MPAFWPRCRGRATSLIARAHVAGAGLCRTGERQSAHRGRALSGPRTRERQSAHRGRAALSGPVRPPDPGGRPRHAAGRAVPGRPGAEWWAARRVRSHADSEYVDVTRMVPRARLLAELIARTRRWRACPSRPSGPWHNPRGDGSHEIGHERVRAGRGVR